MEWLVLMKTQPKLNIARRLFAVIACCFCVTVKWHCVSDWYVNRQSAPSPVSFPMFLCIASFFLILMTYFVIFTALQLVVVVVVWHACSVTKLCLTLCNPMDCSPPGSSVHGISQERTLEWAAIFFSRGSSQPRDRTCVSCIVGGFFTTEPAGKLLRVDFM